MPDLQTTARRAALLAHALAPRDRAWLLSRLGDDHCGVIAALLRELRSMRIAPDPRLVRELLDAGMRETPGQLLSRLQGRALADLVSVLRAEPCRLVARFLRAGPWPWRAEVLSRLDPRVTDCLANEGDLPQAASLDEALVAAVADAVHRRASEGASGAIPASPDSLWARCIRAGRAA